MNTRIAYFIFACVLLSACVKQPAIKEGGYALIRSNYPIVKLNGNEIEGTFKLDIMEGKNTLVIVYNTYRHDYYCTFSWNAEVNTVYEVTSQENRYPLTLYRWVRTNALWASRLDPQDPLECIETRRNQNNSDKE